MKEYEICVYIVIRGGRKSVMLEIQYNCFVCLFIITRLGLRYSLGVNFFLMKAELNVSLVTGNK